VTRYARWADIRAAKVARAGGEAAVEAGTQGLLAVSSDHRLAEVRRTRGLTSGRWPGRMGVTNDDLAKTRSSARSTYRRPGSPPRVVDPGLRASARRAGPGHFGTVAAAWS
jgi:hypothetical protein